jgi:hypothetical protein
MCVDSDESWGYSVEWWLGVDSSKL